MTYIVETLKSSCLLVLCLIVSRFIGFPANFTPILACAVFLPFMTNNKYIQMFLPVSIMIITDPFLGLYSAMPVVYLCVIVASIISSLFKIYNYKKMIFAAFASVVIWHLIVNFSVWATGLQTLPLSAVYIAAIPFDLRLLVSTIVFSSLFYIFRSVFLGWYSRLDSN